MKKNKKNRKPLNPREKNLYRYWVWMLLIGPAVFFFAYWYWQSTGPGESGQGKQAVLPQKYSPAGEPVMVNGKTLLAAPGGRVTFTEELAVGNNRVVVEEGHVFLVVPLIAPDQLSNQEPSRWRLVDEEGSLYRLLKVFPENPAAGRNSPGISRENLPLYLVFKVEKGTGHTFLVYTPPGEDYAAWKIPPQP